MRRPGPYADQNIHIQRNEFARHIPKAFRNFIRKAVLQYDVTPINVAEFFQSLDYLPEVGTFLVSSSRVPKDAYSGNPLGLLPVRSGRPSDRRAAEGGDEIAPFHDRSSFERIA